ncbi:MAG: plasmid pRiA4b ORF-3 family protein, partial [Bacteroidota bacterium]
IDKGFAEAENLDFKFELTDYDFDTVSGYSITALLAHSAVCIRMAAMGQDHDYCLELLDDLVRTNLPEEFLASIGRHIVLEVIPEDSEDGEAEERISHFIESWSSKYPKAIGIISGIMEGLRSALLDNLFPESSSNYPAALGQHFPWPRNPGNVDNALQLRINIIDSKPEIYRTLVVPDDTLLPDLHGMLQVAFDWEEAHLYEFIHAGQRYLTGETLNELPAQDARKVRIGELLTTVGEEMIYRYDFGDDWQHRIVLEATPPVDDEILYPRCIAGARRGPAEDSGGIHHYQHILTVLQNPEHEQYSEFRVWLPEDFDPDEFVLAWTHKQLWKGRFWNMGWGDELSD